MLIYFFIILFKLQLYEGGSTIFGPHTLAIYLKQYEKLASAAINVSCHYLCMINIKITCCFFFFFQMNNLTEGIPPKILDHFYLSQFFSPEALVEDSLYKPEEPYGSCVKQPEMIVLPGETASADFVIFQFVLFQVSLSFK